LEKKKKERFGSKSREKGGLTVECDNTERKRGAPLRGVGGKRKKKVEIEGNYDPMVRGGGKIT